MSLNLLAQTPDTIRIFHYNLLNYGNTNNETAKKNPKLKIIIDHVKPDIFVANEIANNQIFSKIIVDSVLNQNGRKGWKRANYSNTGGQTQTNLLFYNSSMFELKSQKVVYSNLRDIIAFNMYCLSEDLANGGDTVFFTIISCHLKASNDQANLDERAVETSKIVAYLNAQPKGNYFITGDFNVTASSERAYQNLIFNANEHFKMVDPIAKPGNWSANSSFANIHTQSTRNADSQDGGVPGGLDDRFDFILCNNYAMYDSAGISYIPGTYKVVGNDGQHFNKAINDGSNTSVPSNVLSALFGMSDHLPIHADFKISKKLLTNIKSIRANTLKVFAENPINGNINLLFGNENIGKNTTITLLDINGKIVNTFTLVISNGSVTLPNTNALAQGTYILNVLIGNDIAILKLIK